jgi:hypothetical protein
MMRQSAFANGTIIELSWIGNGVAIGPSVLSRSVARR